MSGLQQQEPKARSEFGKIFLDTSTAENTLVADISIYLDDSIYGEIMHYNNRGIRRNLHRFFQHLRTKIMKP